MVKTPQGPRYVTKMKVGLTQWANKAASGNMKAIEEAVRWNQEIDERAPLLHPPDIRIIVVDSKQKQIPRKVATNNSDG